MTPQQKGALRRIVKAYGHARVDLAFAEEYRRMVSGADKDTISMADNSVRFWETYAEEALERVLGVVERIEKRAET